MIIKVAYIFSYAMMLFSVEWFVFALQMTFFKKQMKRIPAAIAVTVVSSLMGGVCDLFAVGSYGEGANIFAYIEDFPMIVFAICPFFFFKKKKILCAVENVMLFLISIVFLLLNYVFFTEMVLERETVDNVITAEYVSGYETFGNLCVSLLVVILCLYMYFRLYKTGKYHEVKRIHGFILLGMICVNEIIIFFSYYFPYRIKWFATWIFVLLILMSIVLPIFMISVQIRRKTEFKNILQEEMIKSEMTYIENYKEKQEETKRMRHDMKNNLALLSMLLEQGKYDEARQYLSEMNRSVWMASPKFVTGDSYLDCILTMKSEAVESEGIDFRLNGVIEGGLDWPPMDVVAVFGNALDNAIEECRKIPEGMPSYIDFKIRRTETFVIVRIENPVARDVDTSLFDEVGALPTSKADKELHGYGLSNINRVAKCHNGIVKCECDNERFVLSLMISSS